MGTTREPERERFLRRYSLVCAALAIGIFLTGVSRPAIGQGFETVVQPNGQVLPQAGTMVRAMKRASDGSYYVLTKVSNVVSVYGPDGALKGRIPNAASGGAVIKYAADIDLDSDGNLLVADQGANAVIVFRSDGSLLATIPVNLPVSVAALPGRQFAVLTLRPRRLVTIMNQDGKIVSSFGNLADAGIDPERHDLVTLGKITGDPSGDIYLGITSLPDPLVRKYDRYGWASYSASIDDSVIAPIPPQHEDRVQFSLNFTQMNFSSQFHASLTVGTSGSVRFATGMGMGLNGLLGGGPTRGGGPMMGGGMMGSEMMGGGPMMGGASFGSMSGSGGPPMGPANMGAEISGTGSLRSGLFHFRLGLGSSGPRGGSRPPDGGNGPTDSSNDSHFSLGASGSDFQVASSSSGDDSYGSPSAILSESQGSSDAQNLSINSANQTYSFDATGADLSMGISPGMIQPAMSAGGFGGGAFGGPGAGGRPPLGGGPRAQGQLSQSSFSGAPLGGSGMPQGQFGSGNFSGAPAFNAHPEGGGANGFRFGPPGHFGAGMSNIVGTVRVNLDRNRDTDEKAPTISAMAFDPDTNQLWVAIGNRLLAFDKDGQLVETSGIATPGETTMHANSLIVERDRILIATDSSGVLSFGRPSSTARSLAVPVAMQTENPRIPR